jgi:hypothetical protein
MEVRFSSMKENENDFYFSNRFKSTTVLPCEIKYLSIVIRCQFHQQHFMRADHKSAKNTFKLSVFFVHLGSVGVKSVHKMLVKLTQECAINVATQDPIQIMSDSEKKKHFLKKVKNKLALLSFKNQSYKKLSLKKV